MFFSLLPPIVKKFLGKNLMRPSPFLPRNDAFYFYNPAFGVADFNLSVENRVSTLDKIVLAIWFRIKNVTAVLPNNQIGSAGRFAIIVQILDSFRQTVVPSDSPLTLMQFQKIAVPYGSGNLNPFLSQIAGHQPGSSRLAGRACLIGQSKSPAHSQGE